MPPTNRYESDPDDSRRDRRNDGWSTGLKVGLILGAFFFLGCPFLIVVSIAAITALGSNANSTFGNAALNTSGKSPPTAPVVMIPGDVKPAPTWYVTVNESLKYCPVRTDVDRQALERDVIGKHVSELKSLFGDAPVVWQPVGTPTIPYTAPASEYEGTGSYHGFPDLPRGVIGKPEKHPVKLTTAAFQFVTLHFKEGKVTSVTWSR